MSNCIQLIKLTKGKGIIMAADVNRKIFMRSPLDCENIAKAIGLTQD